MKKCFAVLFALALVFLWGCSGQSSQVQPTQTADDTQFHTVTAGIALPENSSQFKEEGAAICARLEEMGFAAVVEYAGQDAQQQNDQLQRMLTQGVDCLIVAAVDPLVLTEALQQAEKEGVPVISYDRVLTGYSGAKVHIGFDYYATGQEAARQVVQEKLLDTASQEGRSHTVEFFAGPPEDGNAYLWHQGLMAVLQPYLDSGVLRCLSGRVSFEDTCTSGWSMLTAKDDCQKYLEKYYSLEPLEICITAWDTLADGVVRAFEGQKNQPLLTGQGATSSAMDRLEQGSQKLSFRYDRQALAQQCAEAAIAVLSGAAPQTNGTLPGSELPAWLLIPELIQARKAEQ